MKRAPAVLLAVVLVAIGVAIGGVAFGLRGSNGSRKIAVLAGDGTTGQLTYQENFLNPPLALLNTTGGKVNSPQAGNFGTACTYFNNRGKWFANWYPDRAHAALAPVGGVTNYADMNMNVPGFCAATTSGTALFEAIANGGPHYSTNFVGRTTYHSLAVWVPPGGLAVGGGSVGWEIQELGFANELNGAAIRFGLHSDHVTVLIDSGACVQGSYCQYHSDGDHYPNHPAGSTVLPGVWAIPRGGMTAGAWNEIVVRVHWAPDTSGSVTAWYRASNPASGVLTGWQLGGMLNGFATSQFARGHSPPNLWNDGPEMYGFAGKVNYDIDLAGYSDATGFAAAASALP